MDKCPRHPIDISEDREIVFTDEKEYSWNGDSKGYFLVKIEKGLICCGFVGSDHKMAIEFRGKDSDKIIKEIAERDLCSTGNMGYITSELMIAKDALGNGKKYVQR